MGGIPGSAGFGGCLVKEGGVRCGSPVPPKFGRDRSARFGYAKRGPALSSATPCSRKLPGGDLLSQGVAPQVPSALAGLTSVFGMGTGGSLPLYPPDKSSSDSAPRALHSEHVSLEFNPSPRPISTGRLNALLRLHLRPINLVFYQGPYRVKPVGDLISGWVSHLDAFSAYPFRT